MSKQEIFRVVKETDDLKLSTLGVRDQIQLLLKRMSNDDVAELKARSTVSVNEVKKVAGLTNFFNLAIDEMNKNNANSVTLSVSSEFLPYIDKVVDPITGLGRFYTFEVFKRDLPFKVKHKFIVKIHKQVSGEVL